MSSISAGLRKVLRHSLLQLDRPIPPLSESEIEAEVERNYRWNFTVNLLDGIAFWIGLNFAPPSTILPLFISKLTMNPLIIGLIAVIAQSGWNLPQLFVAGPTERLARKKPVVVNLGFFLERVPLWLWPLAALIATRSPILAATLLLVAYAWHALGAGIIAPAWQDMIAKCFPVKRRGRFFGLTTFIGTGVGAVSAILSSWLLKTYSFPVNFLYVFLLAAIFITLSWVFLALTREPVQSVAIPHLTIDQFWSKLMRIIQRDHNFRQFLQARLLMAMGGMGVGFVTVAAVRQWQIADSTAGLYTVALLLGQAGGNLLSGFLSDHFGHKFPLEIGAVCMALAFILAWLAPAPVWYYPVFTFIGISIGIIFVSGIMITMEFSPSKYRPTYIGIANTIIGLGGSVAPLVGGWLASWSYDVLFVLSAGINLISLILFRWYVKEPRHQPENDVITEITTDGKYF
jgi:MFS family permease